MKKSNSGFTLIEAMIVVAIIGIISAVAYPSYQNYTKKTKRTDCKGYLMEIASAIEKEKIAYKRYTAIPATKIGLSATGTGFCGTKTIGAANYTIALDGITDGKINKVNWVITATPTNQLAGTGVIKLNQKGQKCWKKDQNDCTLSATSTWDE